MKYLKAFRFALSLCLGKWDGKNIPFSSAWKVAGIIHLGK